MKKTIWLFITMCFLGGIIGFSYSKFTPEDNAHIGVFADRTTVDESSRIFCVHENGLAFWILQGAWIPAIGEWTYDRQSSILTFKMALWGSLEYEVSPQPPKIVKLKFNKKKRAYFFIKSDGETEQSGDPLVFLPDKKIPEEFLEILNNYHPRGSTKVMPLNVIMKQMTEKMNETTPRQKEN